MKHPALTRAMAAALVIMCAIMLLSGVFGIGKAEKNLASDKEEYERLTGRIATYNELTAKLDGGDSYKVTSEKLDARQEQHDKDASDYRTDLAERAAKQGGYKKGADTLWEAKSEVDAAVNGYRQASSEFETAKKEFAEKKAQAEALAAQCNSLAQACTTADSIPEPEAPGEEPAPVADPSTTWTAEQIQADPDGYAAASAAYNDYLKKKAEYDTKKTAYETVLGQKQAALGGANAMLAALELESAADLAAASAMLSGYAANISAELASGQAAIDEMAKKLEDGGSKLTQAQVKVDGSLEQIWYELGKMEDEEPELEESRERLLAEADELALDRQAADDKKEDERRLASTRAILKGYDGIKTRLDAGGELAECAAQYADEYYAGFNRDYAGRLAVCILEIVGGALGFACIPAAYEKSRSRFLLLAPAAASLVCAAAAECVALRIGLGQCYAAMPAMIFAMLYLLSAAPKNRQPQA